ncbi:MAG: hypothetical protein WBB19_17485 [Desulforhopalus sp.]
MKNMTAEKVLRKTFKHLDKVLDEKSRELKQNAKESHPIAEVPDRGKREKRPDPV